MRFLRILTTTNKYKLFFEEIKNAEF
jgi:hypothetical protein